MLIYYPLFLAPLKTLTFEAPPSVPLSCNRRLYDGDDVGLIDEERERIKRLRQGVEGAEPGDGELGRRRGTNGVFGFSVFGCSLANKKAQ